MRWVKRIAIALAAILLLLIVAVIGVWLWKPWVPPAEMTDPAPQG